MLDFGVELCRRKSDYILAMMLDLCLQTYLPKLQFAHVSLKLISQKLSQNKLPHLNGLTLLPVPVNLKNSGDWPQCNTLELAPLVLKTDANAEVWRV